MNTTATNNGGWETSNMRSYVGGTIVSLIPSNVHIVPVTKYSAGSVATTDYVWIPSHRELFSNTSYESTGAVYSNKFTTYDARKKMSQGSVTAYALRTADTGGTDSFVMVAVTGGVTTRRANMWVPFAIGFCT